MFSAWSTEIEELHAEILIDWELLPWHKWMLALDVELQLLLKSTNIIPITLHYLIIVCFPVLWREEATQVI